MCVSYFFLSGIVFVRVVVVREHQSLKCGGGLLCNRAGAVPVEFAVHLGKVQRCRAPDTAENGFELKTTTEQSENQRLRECG